MLVIADETIGGRWAIYNYNGNEYVRTLTQSYDVRAYWEYRDWYAQIQPTYTNKPTIVVLSQLYGLDDSIREVVKISSCRYWWLVTQKKLLMKTLQITV